MADLTIVRSRLNDKPGHKVMNICASFSTTDTTGTLKVANGNLIRVSGISVGVVVGGIGYCTDTPSAGIISPTASTSGAPYINVARSEAGSATKYFFAVEYDSQ